MNRLNDFYGKRCIGLEIDGLKYRYHTFANPLPNPNIETDFNFILDVGSINANLNELAGGRAIYNPCNLSLSIARNGGLEDPSRNLISTIRHSDIFKAVLQQDISRGDLTPNIVIDVEPNFSFPKTLYIGSETFTCSGYSIGPGSNFTITTTERNGPRQNHAIRLDGVDAPFVTDKIINFRGRRARLYMGFWDASTNEVVDSTLILNGFLESNPILNDNGTLGLSIVPLSAMFDNSVASRNNKSYLSTGGHFFKAYNRKYLNLTSIVNNVDYPSESPRDQYAIIINEEGIDIDHWMSSSDMVAKINYLGRFTSLKFGLSQQLGVYNLTTEFSSFQAVAGDTVLGLLYSEALKLTEGYFREKSTPFNNFLCLKSNGNIDFVLLNTEEVNFNTALDLISSNQVLKEIDISLSPSLPPDMRRLYTISNPPNDDFLPKIDVKGLADAFYLFGEGYLCIENSLDLPSVATAGISYGFQIKQGDKSYFIKFTHEESLPNGKYLVYLDQNDPESRNLPPINQFINDENRVEIIPALTTNKVTPIEALLRFLMSGGGAKVNGEYDLDQVGLNLTSDDIDINSFLSFENRSELQSWQLNVPLDDDISISDLADPILTLLGAVLVMNSEGKIALREIKPNLLNSAKSLSREDMFIEPQPASSIREDLISQFTVKYNYSRIGEPSEAIFNNYACINLVNSEASQMDLNLYGVSKSDVGFASGSIYSFLRPTIARLFDLYGSPLIEHTFTIPSGLGWDLFVGDTVLVSCDLLLSYSGGFGISNVPCLISSIEKNTHNEGCRVSVIDFAKDKTALYNMGAQVIGLTSSTQLSFSLNTFSSNDLGLFKAGDVVRLVNKFNQSSFQTRTIQSISNNIVTFTSAHSILTTNTIMIATTYDTASSLARQYCFASEAGNVLGSANDEGFKYE